MAENNRSEQEILEEMIRKYKEEAMRYQERSNTLYQERMPAKEVNATYTNTDIPQVTWREETEEAKMPSESDTIPEMPSEDIEGAGDVTYESETISIDEVLQESDFIPRTEPYTDTGELQVEASAAIRSLPIDLADVLVLRATEGEQELIRYLQTNNSGNTPVITLPAPSRDLSEQPEPSGVRPYGVYTVVVSHPDYYTTIIRDVQIFAGQRAILPVNLIPLSEKLTNSSAPNNNINTVPHQLNE